MSKIQNKKNTEGRKDIEFAFALSSGDKVADFFVQLEKWDILYEDKGRKYKVIDGAHKRQDDVVMQLLLDIDRYEDKNTEIINMLYEKFGFQNSDGFEDCSKWFVDAETVILKPSDFLKDKDFLFFFRPLEQDRESRKFIMTNTGTHQRSYFIDSIKGKFIRHDLAGSRVLYLFLVKEFTVNKKTYTGSLPENITREKKEESGTDNKAKIL